nr:OTU domain-containing protein 5-like [Equus asinus]
MTILPDAFSGPGLVLPSPFGRPQAPPPPLFTPPSRILSAVSAGGGPGRSEPRRRRRRGSRGSGDGGRGGATGRAPLGVTAAAAAAAAATRSASPAEHGDSLCSRPPHLAQLEEAPALGADGCPREGVSGLARPYRLRGDAAAE